MNSKEEEKNDEASTSSTSRPGASAEALIRNKKQEEWASTLKLEDVVFNESLTEIVSIAGKPFNIFRSKMLLSFCRGNQITVSNGKTKKQDCVEHILNYKKHGPLRAKVAQSIKKNKGTKPACVYRLYEARNGMITFCLRCEKNMSYVIYLTTS